MKTSNFFVVLALSAATGFTASAQQAFHIQKTFRLPGDGGWDYLAVSPLTNKLYVAHGTEVTIVDKATGATVGSIPDTKGVHGIAFAPAYGKGYTSNGKSNTLTVFDMKTDKVTGAIAVGQNPDAIMYEPYSKMIVVCNGRSNDLTILDPATNKVVKTISLSGKPETAVSDEKGKLFVNIEDKSELVVVDLKTFAVVSSWHTGKGEEPSGLAMDLKTRRLFAGCGNKLLVVMDADNGKVIKEIPIGEGCDGVVFDPYVKQVYSSNGSGTLTIIKEKTADEYIVAADLPTKKGARTIALDPATHLLYLPTAGLGKAEKGKRSDILPGSFEVMVIGSGK